MFPIAYVTWLDAMFTFVVLIDCRILRLLQTWEFPISNTQNIYKGQRALWLWGLINFLRLSWTFHFPRLFWAAIAYRAHCCMVSLLCACWNLIYRRYCVSSSLAKSRLTVDVQSNLRAEYLQWSAGKSLSPIVFAVISTSWKDRMELNFSSKQFTDNTTTQTLGAKLRSCPPQSLRASFDHPNWKL